MYVGVYYCGGCNPRYDRKAVVEYLQARLPGCLLEPVREGTVYDVYVAICGCETGCTVRTASCASTLRTNCSEDLLQVERDIKSMQKGMTEWIGRLCTRAD